MKSVTKSYFIMLWFCSFLIFVPICSDVFSLDSAKQGIDLSKYARFKIRISDISKSFQENPPVFPKYTTQLINIANQNAQSTRPKAVGQMSELVFEFNGDDYNAWVSWYLNRYPNAIDTAADKTFAMVQKLQKAILQIDREMVKTWITDLVLAKSWAGLHCQESIIKKIAKKKEKKYRLATPIEESRGIDGYIGIRPVSVKPVSYQSKNMLDEDIRVDIIWYKKVRGGIEVFYDF
ncbi:MjaI family restriction endonuclease [Desulfobacterales bacterium HSG16]|nr:MjaI family restriction endonuclease [Desulfobacterales bacterium HSG16]